jgi:hypothetical protein
MRVRLVLVIVAAAVLGVLVFPWVSANERQPPAPAPVPPAPPAAVATPPAAVPAAREEVQPAAPPAVHDPAQEEAFDPAPVHVTPWLARFLVVDDDEHPLADAVVTVWPAKKMRVDAHPMKLLGDKGRKYSYSGHEAEPLFEVHTDAQGQAQARLDLECFEAAANKAGLGSSGTLSLWNTRAAAAETKFVIEAPVVLRGIVLRADGPPAAGARVVASVNGWSGLQLGQAPVPAPTTTGADGRFTLQVHKGSGYNVHAELDGAKTFAEHVWALAHATLEITLAFPGGITLAGLVVDADGRPVAKAEVSAWREFHLDDPHQDPDDERVYVRCDDQGRFSVPVRRYARYQLIASADGQANSRLLWTETTAVRPHPEVRLELLRFATIKGRVLHDDGSPFAGVLVFARPETGERLGYSSVPTQRDMFPDVKSMATGDDGAFTLTVHPATTWTILAQPVAANYRLRRQQTGIAPGRTDVELRISAADLAGCIVHGRVVRADGQPVGTYGVEIVNYAAGKPESSGDAQPRIDGDTFTLLALPRGQQFGLRVTPNSGNGTRARYDGPVAPAQVGPFTTDQPELTLEFRLEAWGEVPVRVLAADGMPAHKVRVNAVRDVGVGFGRSAQRVDAEGRVTLMRCAPGPHHLFVFDDSTKVGEQELLITPGPNPEVVVHLLTVTPATGAGR